MQTLQLTLRAVIMLATLIVVPLIAIFGKQLPELAQGWWDANMATRPWQTRPPEGSVAPPATGARELLAKQSLRADLSLAPRAASAPLANTPIPPQPAPLRTNAAGTSPFAPTVAGEPQLLPPGAPAAPLLARQSSPITGMNAASAVRPAWGAEPAPPVNAVSPASTGNLSQDPTPALVTAEYTQTIPAAAAQTAMSTNQLAELAPLSRQLKELGASYFRLETDGTPANQFVCYCQLTPPAGGPVKTFTARHAIPQAAMGDVIRQINHWRAGTSAESVPPANNSGVVMPTTLQPPSAATQPLAPSTTGAGPSLWR
ncbi:MAG: hypothetical protein SFX18_18500 [Pirellulales bacterium]|nr:hypothetical protein [Pirellulales bacterium]